MEEPDFVEIEDRVFAVHIIHPAVVRRAKIGKTILFERNFHLVHNVQENKFVQRGIRCHNE